MPLFVTSATSDFVSVIDTTNGKVVETPEVANFPFDVAPTPDGTQVYVASYAPSGGAIWLIDTRSYEVSQVDITQAGDQPVAVTVSPDGAFVLFATVDGIVVRAQTGTSTPTERVPMTGQSTCLDVTPDGSFLYVGSDARQVSVFGLTPWSPGPGPHVSMYFDHDLNILFTPLCCVTTAEYVYLTGGTGEQCVAQISLATGVVAYFGSPELTISSGLAISADGSRIYTSHGNGTVAIFETSSGPSLIGSPIAVALREESNPIALLAIALSPDGTRLYISSLLNDSLYVLDTATRQLVGQPIAVTHPGPLALATPPPLRQLAVRYVDVDPLTLILPNSFYVHLRLPNPPPVGVLREQISSVVAAMTISERRQAMRDAETMRSYLDTVVGELTKAGETSGE